MSSGGGLELRPVRDAHDIRAFGEAARAAQGHDPNWVAPLDYELRFLLDRGRNVFLQENEVEAWVALRDGRPLGRIVAVRNAAHLAKHADATGQFGFLEGVDEESVFAALVGQAEDWLRVRGLRRMTGPFSASINHEAGLLVEGFDTPPMMRTNHAQPWYGTRLEALGLRPIMDLLAHLCHPAESAYPERVAATLARWKEHEGLTIRSMTQRSFAADMDLVNDLYNDAWADNWNAVPVGPAEARLIASLVRPLLRLDWITIAYWQGEPIAVVSQVPNVNEAIAGLDGALFPLGWAKIAWRLKLRGLRSSRVPLIGVRRAYRATRVGGMAVAALMARAIENARAAGIERMEISWMLAHNRHVLNLVESLPAQHYKTFRVYEKGL